MTRAAILLALFAFTAGCRRASEPAPASTGGGNDALVNYARKNAPVLDRTLVEEDLRTIGTFMMTFRAERGHLPKSWAELKAEMQRDARKVVAKIEAGDFVINYNPGDGDILAYDTRYSDQLARRIVLRGNGSPEVVTLAEFEKLAAKVKR